MFYLIEQVKNGLESRMDEFLVYFLPFPNFYSVMYEVFFEKWGSLLSGSDMLANCYYLLVTFYILSSVK